MSATIDKGYISKKKKGSSDYEHFHREGIELLQRFSGGEWTDYNEHDPGVTILENLAYTLTELSFKTNQPIADILRESKGAELKSGDNALFVPEEILTTNPVTPKDYRKLIIDRIKNVKNAFVFLDDSDQSNTPTPSGQLGGLYTIYVESYQYSTDPAEFKKEENRIVGEITQLFHAHRNLCEDLYKVIWCTPLYLDIQLKLTIDESANGEKLFARVFYDINDYLTHDVRFRSLSELQQVGMDTNLMYDGPFLENGFILDDELGEPHDLLLPSEVLKVISRLQGVAGVDFFQLVPVGTDANDLINKPIEDEGLEIPKNRVVRLRFPESSDFLKFMHEGVEFTPNLDDVAKRISYLEALSYGSFKSVSEAANEMGIPNGKDKHLNQYYSIREQFPLIYGIGEFGLADDLPAKRYAQAKQFKGYLLPFDQLMTDHLAQLTHIFDLYSIHGDTRRSYFTQVLDDMDKVANLIHGTGEEQHGDVLDVWQNTLLELNQTIDPRPQKRLNEVADHLFSRFAETYPSYALKKINRSTFGNHVNEMVFEQKLLENKRKLLSDYSSVSYNRAKSYDSSLSPEVWQQPALLRKVGLQFGITNMALRPLCEGVLQSGLKMFKRTEPRVNPQFENLGKPEDNVEFEDLVIIDDEAGNLSDSYFFSGTESRLLKDVLKYGVVQQNYQIRQTSNPKNRTFYVLFVNPQGSTKVIHISDSEKDAKHAIVQSIRFFEKLNQESEGAYLLEHLLLAPPYEEAYFGYSLEIPTNVERVKFTYTNLQTHKARNATVAELKEVLARCSGNCKTFVKYDLCFVGLYSQKGELLAESLRGFKSEERAECLARYMNTSLVTRGAEILESIQYEACYGDESINEEIFSYQMTVLLPDWSARFQDHNFRTKFSNMITSEAPIYIATHCKWLGFDQMEEFEYLYQKWSQLAASKEFTKDKMEASAALLNMLQYMS